MDTEEHDDWPLIPQFRSIPTEFHSLEFDGPFMKCLLCDGDLFAFHRQYSIARYFRGAEPIVEYAMCFDCQQDMCSDLSEESQRNIETFFQQVDQEARIEHLGPHLKDDHIAAWIDECVVTRKKRADCLGYQIVAVCQGPELQLSFAPFMLSLEALEQMSALVSKKTRERLGDFMGDHFGMPPEFCEQPDIFPVLF